MVTLSKKLCTMNKIMFQGKYAKGLSYKFQKSGLCYAFNMELPSKMYNETKVYGWAKPSNFENAAKSRLDAVVQTPHKDLGFNIDVVREDGTHERDGYRIAIHSPYEFIDNTFFHMKINFQQPLLFLVTPKMITIDQSVASMSTKE